MTKKVEEVARNDQRATAPEGGDFIANLSERADGKGKGYKADLEAIRAGTEKALEEYKIIMSDEMDSVAKSIGIAVDKWRPIFAKFENFAEQAQATLDMWAILSPYMKEELEAHPEIYGDDEHPEVGADVPFSVVVAAAAKRARAAGVDVPMLAVEETQDLIISSALFVPGKTAPSFSGKLFSALAKARPRGVVSPFEDYLSIDDVVVKSKNPNRYGVSEAKLLRYAVSAFTKLNAQNEKNITLRVQMDTREYAKLCKVPIDRQIMSTQEEQEREDKRATKALENFIQKLGKSGANLKAALSWSEVIQHKFQSYTDIDFISGFQVNPKIITVEFSLSAGEYMVKLPLSDYPSSFYAISDRMFNAFAIADKLIQHYTTENNVVVNTERIIKVENLLKCTSFPSIAEIKAKRNSWVKLVKGPFEDAMEELYKTGVIAKEVIDSTGKRVSGGWRYSLSKMQELTDEQAAAIIDKGYAEFASLYVVFDLAGYEPHEVRAAAIAEKKAKALEKVKKRGKRKKTKKATDGSGDATES